MAQTFTSMAEVKEYQEAHPDQFVCVYENKVLNVAAFIDEHPGGPDSFDGMRAADITESFDAVGHSGFATEQMEGMLIGTLAAGGAAKSNQRDEAEVAKRRPSWLRTELVPTLCGVAVAVGVFMWMTRRARA